MEDILALRPRGCAARWRDAAAVRVAPLTSLRETTPVERSARSLRQGSFTSGSIVLAVTRGMLRRTCRAGVGGWRKAAVTIAAVLALPVLGARNQVPPMRVVDCARRCIAREGVGAVGERRPIANRHV